MTAKSSETAREISGGRSRQKARTRQLLLQTAAQLLAAGQRPTVTDVADAASVSRRTAYRYFPSAEKLYADAALDNLRPAMEAAMQATLPTGGDAFENAELRVEALVKEMQRLAIDNEMLLRTMIRETVMQPEVQHVGPQRGARRLEWIRLALKPLAHQLAPGKRKRLVCALALCTGIEALLVFRDICGLSETEATKVGQWMCRTLLKETLQEPDS
jgi:AcrR family transcriptional regulator